MGEPISSNKLFVIKSLVNRLDEISCNFTDCMLPYHDLDDQALFVEIQKGDHQAFSEVYYRYHKSIYLYIIKVIKLNNLAEDLVQEVFVRLWEIRTRITIHSSFEAYLYRISRNMTYRKLSSIIADRELRQAIINGASPAITLHEYLKEKEYEQLVNDAVKQLPPQRQRVFQLCRGEGMTYSQVSEQLGISRNTIKEHMTEAMRFIKKYVIEKGDIVLVLMVWFQLA